MEKLEGYIEHIVFRNEENGYTVLSMISEGEEITCVGSFPYISEGERLAAIRNTRSTGVSFRWKPLS